MSRSDKRFLSKTSSLVLLCGLLAVTSLGQDRYGRVVECKEKDYDCRLGNYRTIVWNRCDAEGQSYDCWIAEKTKIVEAHRDDAAAYYYRGFTYSIKDPDRAILDYQKALELDPKAMFVYIPLASAHIQKKEYDHALLGLNKAIELDPKLANAYDVRGHIYSRQGEFDKALAEFSKEIELEPKGEAGYRGRGEVYFSLQKFDQAIAEYSKAIEAKPSDWFNYYNRGFIFWKKGEKTKAEADCQKAKELKRLDRGTRKPTSSEYCSF